MTDNNKDKRIKLSDLLRYEKGEMTGKERNDFERELQKDPFAEEAEEGFSMFSPEKTSKDIKRLQTLIGKRTKRKSKIIWYRIAASIAVLMIISSVFVVVQRGKPSLDTVQTDSPAMFEIAVDEPLTKPEENEKPPEKKSFSKKFMSEEPVRQETRKEAEPSINEVLPSANDENRIAPVASRRSVERSATENEHYISANKPAKTDTSPPDEIIVTGYAAEKSAAVDSGYFPPQPEKGKDEFDKYIKANLNRPDSSGQRVVVIVAFKVLIDGTIDSIRVIRSPDGQFSDEAVRLIRSGPAWKAAERNGISIEDEVRLRIVFN